MCGAGQVLTWLLFGGLPLCPRMLACLQPPWSLGAYPWAPSCCAAQPWVERWQPVVPHFTHTFPQPLCHILVSHQFFLQLLLSGIEQVHGIWRVLCGVWRPPAQLRIQHPNITAPAVQVVGRPVLCPPPTPPPRCRQQPCQCVHCLSLTSCMHTPSIWAGVGWGCGVVAHECLRPATFEMAATGSEQQGDKDGWWVLSSEVSVRFCALHTPHK